MTSQAWAVIGVGVGVIALGIAGFGLLWNAINKLSIRIDAQGAELGARIDAQALRTDALGLRIDGIEHVLHDVNRSLGELLGTAHIHDQAA